MHGTGVSVVVGPRSLQTDSAVPRPMSPSTSVAPQPPTRPLFKDKISQSFYINWPWLKDLKINFSGTSTSKEVTVENLGKVGEMEHVNKSRQMNPESKIF